jgi:tRNA-dihydrouridine synthase B
MIGRAAMGYPFIFREVNNLLRTGDAGPAPTPMERCEAASLQLEWMAEHRDENRAVHEFRKHIILYSKGLYNCSQFKNRVVQLTEKDAVIAEMQNYFSNLPDVPTPRPRSALDSAPTWQ